MPTFPNINVTQAAAGSSQKEALLNEALTALDAYEGVTSVAIVAGANTLTEAQARSGLVNLTGALASAATVTIPSTLAKLLMVTNSTTGGQTVQVRYGTGGTLYTVLAGDFLLIWPTGSRTFTTGASITRGTYASRPAAGTSGRLYLPTDGAHLFHDNGTSWQGYGPAFPLTPPVLADFTQVNMGASVVTEAGGTVTVETPVSAVENYRLFHRAAPATPYTVTARIIPNLFGVNFAMFGICWRENATGKIDSLNLAQVNTMISGLELARRQMTNATTFSGTPTAVDAGNPAPTFLRLSDDGATKKMLVSRDGRNWLTLVSVARTDFFTPDQVGWYANSLNATYPMQATLIHWLHA